jgi:hypothetical protein
MDLPQMIRSGQFYRYFRDSGFIISDAVFLWVTSCFYPCSVSLGYEMTGGDRFLQPIIMLCR